MRKIPGLPELPPRRADSNKGDYGRVLVLAGSRGMVGAAAMAGTAALRAGAGLVTIGTPRERLSDPRGPGRLLHHAPAP